MSNALPKGWSNGVESKVLFHPYPPGVVPTYRRNSFLFSLFLSLTPMLDRYHNLPATRYQPSLDLRCSLDTQCINIK